MRPLYQKRHPLDVTAHHSALLQIPLVILLSLPERSMRLYPGRDGLAKGAARIQFGNFGLCLRRPHLHVPALLRCCMRWVPFFNNGQEEAATKTAELPAHQTRISGVKMRPLLNYTQDVPQSMCCKVLPSVTRVIASSPLLSLVLTRPPPRRTSGICKHPTQHGGLWCKGQPCTFSSFCACPPELLGQRAHLVLQDLEGLLELFDLAVCLARLRLRRLQCA